MSTASESNSLTLEMLYSEVLSAYWTHFAKQTNCNSQGMTTENKVIWYICTCKEDSLALSPVVIIVHWLRCCLP